MNILIVRLGALGDVVHAIPAAAALRARVSRRAHRLARRREAPDDRRSRDGRRSHRSCSSARRWRRLDGRRPRAAPDGLRRRDRSSGADEVGGARARVGRGAGRRLLDLAPAREDRAAVLYRRRDERRSRARDPRRTCGCCARSASTTTTIRVSARRASRPPALDRACASRFGRRRSRLINPGAAWPNKRWPPERFGELAAFLRGRLRADAGRAVGARRGAARARSRGVVVGRRAADGAADHR